MPVLRSREDTDETSTPNFYDSQHDHLTSCLGFHLHPTILEDLAAKDVPISIADIKCGTGIYLSSLSETLQSQNIPATLTGFDSSPTRPSSLPSEIEYHARDFLSPPSSTTPPVGEKDYGEKYDVILIRGLHLRLLDSPENSNFSSSSPNWTSTLSAISRIAKPGAWIQWLDFDPLTARIAATRPLAPDAEIRLVLNEFTDAVRARSAGGAGRVDREMEAAGLGEEVDADLYPLRPKVEFTKGLIGEVGEVLTEWGVWKEGEGKRGRVERCIGEVEKAGALVWYDFWCHVGRKKMMGD